MKNRHTSSYTTSQRVWALVLILSSTLSPAVSSAAMFPGLVGRTVLPHTPAAGVIPTGFSTSSKNTRWTKNGTNVEILQNEDKVIINWDSFDIGSNASVRFYQGSGTPGTTGWKPDSSYAVLNRIGSASPSVINGLLTGDGKVYLINRNGVFFGPQGKVQVQSLVASSFNISDDDFKAGLLRFGSPSDATLQSAPNATVSNEGSIVTGQNGSVFLIGPRVQNLGRISAPAGKIDLIGLAPDGQVKISEILEARNADMDVAFSDPARLGDVANMAGGVLESSDGGWIGLYGNTVRNDGIIRAVTARSRNGIIYLLGRDLVATGAGSRTDIEISDSAEKLARTQTFLPGFIKMGGLPKHDKLSHIDHQGNITAPGGNVTMEASDQVFLGASSSIDVSGLSLLRPMSDQFIQVQLNSINLRDSYGQKDNKVILGSTAWVDISKGSTIGNLSGYYLGMEKNARDLSTSGGSITIGASTRQSAYSLNDIVIARGAALNLSGGATLYSGQAPATSRLIGADGKVYDISTAPQWMRYTGVFGTTVKSYGKFGREILQGVSFGGHLLKLTSNVADRTVGGDAGALSLKARTKTGLDDFLNLKAGVTRGYLQTATTAGRSGDSFLASLNRGLERPEGLKLTIGKSLSTNFALGVNIDQDAATHSIALRRSLVQDTAGYVPGEATTLPSNVTEISAAMLNRVGVGKLELNANTTVSTDADAEIVLDTGGSYIARGRRIEFLGSLLAQGGAVEMSIQPNVTSYVPPGSAVNPQYDGTIRETIYLGGNSRIDVSGERIDNSIPNLSPLAMRKSGMTTGGSIVLQQLSAADAATVQSSSVNENSVIISDGARLDVSGGWLINEKGGISGGNAGSLKVQGHTIALGGDLRGHSLPGKDGGEISLHAQEVRVVAPGQGQSLPAGFGIDDQFPNDPARFQPGRLILASDRLAGSGFSRVTLQANDDLTVASGAQLTTSQVKRDLHGAGEAFCTAGGCFSREFPNPQDQGGASSITLGAGVNVYGSNYYDNKGAPNLLENNTAVLAVAAGALVTTPEKGKITLAAPLVDIAGSLSTAGGDIKATASRGDLLVRSGARISSPGYYRNGMVTSAGQLAPLPTAKGGGKVSLAASAGSLILENGALVDVRGAERREGIVRDARGRLITAAVAGDAGSLELGYGLGMRLDGTIAGFGGGVNGTRNGNLAIKNLIGSLTLDPAAVARYQASGFDGLTFSSPTAISLPANLNLAIGRSLTLRAPSIAGSGASGDSFVITAPWMTLIGTNIDQNTYAAANTGGGNLKLLATNLDLQGGLLLEGFNTVDLQATRDLTLAASYYKSDTGGDTAAWRGYLKSDAAGMTLQADRIYTVAGIDTTSTATGNFTVTSPSAYAIETPGTVTTLPGQAANQDFSPLYSAGGNLTISAAHIDHRGFLASPQGSVTLDAGPSGRVDLAPGSVITTAATTPAPYGAYDGSSWWDSYISSNVKGTEVIGAPLRSITVKGRDVNVQSGSIQDLSGGGSVYASIWQPGIPGSKNPLTIPGRYVILPDGSANRAGDSIYLEALPALGLKAGLYSILPIEYAFIPGALVVQDSGKQILTGQRGVSTERYPLVAGYRTTREIAPLESPLRTGFSIRRAVDVLKEGDFSGFRSIANGNGGDFTFQASGIGRFDGALKVAAQPGFKTGNATFAASAIEILAAGTALDPASTSLQLDAKKLSDLRIGTLTLGNSSDTSTVTVHENAVLTAESVTLAARDGVLLDGGNTTVGSAGARVSASAGYATVRTPGGTVTLGSGAALTAAKGGVALDINNAALDAAATIDAGKNGTFAITANGVVFDSVAAQDGYFHMTAALEKLFSSYRSFTIASRGDMVFKRGVNLSTGSLTVDAARYLNDGAATVAFTASEISLLNSGSTHDTTKNPLSYGSGSLTFTGDSVTVAPRQDGTRGSIAFDRFASVNITSANDLVLKGVGTVATGGDLGLTAARITTAGERYKADKTYSAAAISVDARNGAVTLKGHNGTAGTSVTPGGSLQILGKSITQESGLLQVAAGGIDLTSSGDITVKGAISAAGSEHVTAAGEKVYYNGGRIALKSDSGMVDLQRGALLDVSAAVVTDKDGKAVIGADNKTLRRGDAGSISLSAAAAGQGVSIVQEKVVNGVTVAGASLKGQSGTGGRGGSLNTDSATLGAFSRNTVSYAGAGGLNGLAATLKTGGFNENITIRSRGGDLELSGGATLSGRQVQVAADGGNITIGTMVNGTASAGTITADTADGSGRIELYADGKVTLNDKATLSATGTDGGAQGGTVIIGSQDGSDNSKTFNGDYAITASSGATIDVKGNGGAGGTVHFRAYQGKKNAASTGLDDVNMAAFGGTVSGASQVSVEAVKAERFSSDTTISKSSLNGYVGAARSFASTNDTSVKNRLGAAVTDLQGGVELVTALGKNLTIGTTGDATTIDLNSTAEPVVLTLKSGRDLTVNQKIVDAPTALTNLHSSTMKKTAAINLVAGHDGGANFMGVNNGSALTAGSGDLTLASGTWIYSENAPINFAAGNDVTLKGTSTGPATMINSDMKYNLGSYGGQIRGEAGRDLNMTASGSAIQTALGDISITAGRDLNLGTTVNSGAIRTTGEYTIGKTEIAPGLNEYLALPQLAGILNPAYVAGNPITTIVNPAYKLRNPLLLSDKVMQDLAALVYANGGSHINAANVQATVASYWTYHNGGNISVNANRSVNGNLNSANGWDGTYVDQKYFPNGKNLSDGLVPWYLTAGFGGSKEKVTATGYTSANIPVTVGIAAMGGGDVAVTAGGSLTSQVGVFGKGDLSVRTGSDLKGRFRTMDGDADLTSGGGFGTIANPVVNELAHGRSQVLAMGDLQIGSVQNPDNTRDHIFFGTFNQKLWNLTYDQGSSFKAASIAGSATLHGANQFYGYSAYSNSDKYGLSVRQNILPGDVSLTAAGDIEIKENFMLAPSASGNLKLVAGNNIVGTPDLNNKLAAGFIMQDVDISNMYGRQLEKGNSHAEALRGDIHTGINHQGDNSVVRIAAGGNLDTLMLKLNKPAELTAGGDINRLRLIGQNLTPDSVTSIRAGGNIDQGLTLDTRDQFGSLNSWVPTIEAGGPGTLLVQAGGNIRLGDSGGITSIGNVNNSAFSGSGAQTDSDLIVAAGVSGPALAKWEVAGLFETLRSASDEISNLKATGDTEAADRLLAETGQTIRKHFYTYDSSRAASGNIDLVDSAVSSRSGTVYALAGSNINVGKTALSNAPLTVSGITTLYGGAMNVYAGGDVNVNESRIMTYLGGDITVWSDQGNINAGRGSKTVTSAPTPVFTFDSNGVLLAVNYTPPAAGSGIRALTFDVDGSGPVTAPEPGNIHVYAKGTLDAGEAGIQGGKLMIAASAVLNSQNITAGVGSVGVPAASSNTVSIGPMSGTSDVTSDKKLIETISGGGSEAAKKTLLAEAEAFLVKYLDVKVIDLSEGTL